MHRFVKTMFSMIFIILLPFSVLADNLPPNWPWKGVNIDNIDFTKDKLIDVITELNINSVQLRLNPRKLSKRLKVSNKNAWIKSLDWASDMLDVCKDNNISVILTVEGFPVDSEKGYNHTSPKFWFDENNLQEVVNLASELSLRFKNRGSELVAYQLLSEPVIKVGPTTIDPPQLPALIDKVIVALRKNDPNRWIAISPSPWGLPHGYKKFKYLAHKNIIYGAHMYMPHRYTHQGIRQYKDDVISYPGTVSGKEWNKEQLIKAMADLRKFQVKYSVPVWIGEFSAIRWAPGAEQYLIDLIDIFDQYNWSWTYFSLNGWHGWNPNYSNKRSSERNWKSDYIGRKSQRWSTLRNVLNTETKQNIKNETL